MRNASTLAQLLALAGEHVVVVALVRVGRGCGVVESTTICRGGGGGASTGDALGATVTSGGATHDDGGVASARGGGVDDGGACVSTGGGAALSARGGVVGRALVPAAEAVEAPTVALKEKVAADQQTREQVAAEHRMRKQVVERWMTKLPEAASS